MKNKKEWVTPEITELDVDETSGGAMPAIPETMGDMPAPS
jgi:hypothetical protein